YAEDEGAGYAPDVIILATGYETGADHLPEEVIPRTSTGELHLFLAAFPRGRDDLTVLGQHRGPGGVRPILAEPADSAADLRGGVRDGAAAVERFGRRGGAGDAAALPPQAPRGGLLGRVSGALGAAASALRPVSAIRPGDGQLVP